MRLDPHSLSVSSEIIEHPCKLRTSHQWAAGLAFIFFCHSNRISKIWKERRGTFKCGGFSVEEKEGRGVIQEVGAPGVFPPPAVAQP